MRRSGLLMVAHDDDCLETRDVRVWVFLTHGQDSMQNFIYNPR